MMCRSFSGWVSTEEKCGESLITLVSSRGLRPAKSNENVLIGGAHLGKDGTGKLVAARVIRSRAVDTCHAMIVTYSRAMGVTR